MEEQQVAKYSLSDAHNLATERGGKCLSDRYSSKKLLWRCCDNHTWSAKFYSIKRGTWCPYCTWNWREEKCRYVFETIHNCKFPRNRSVLNGIELDGYCAKAKLAFEYHGEQHYHVLKGFWASGFYKRCDRDKLRRRKCAEAGIRLIEIPYFDAKTDDSLVRYITDALQQNAVIDWSNFYENLSVVKILRKIARRKGGKLVSNTYNGSLSPLVWECKKGHQWSSAPHGIKRGHWCLVCQGCLLTIEDAKKLAISRGGECLSHVYDNNRTKLIWKCGKEHVWSAIFDNVFTKGSWCPVCSGCVKSSIDKMREVAASKGGKCLSTSYVNRNTHLLWECEKGHQWQATPGHVKSGTWCPYCAEQVSPTIQDLRFLAQQKGGDCLSETYVNAHTKLLWKCANNHEWWASPTNVKSGKWCRKCGISERKRRGWRTPRYTPKRMMC